MSNHTTTDQYFMKRLIPTMFCVMFFICDERKREQALMHYRPTIRPTDWMCMELFQQHNCLFCLLCNNIYKLDNDNENEISRRTYLQPEYLPSLWSFQFRTEYVLVICLAHCLRRIILRIQRQVFNVLDSRNVCYIFITFYI